MIGRQLGKTHAQLHTLDDRLAWPACSLCRPPWEDFIAWPRDRWFEVYTGQSQERKG